MGITITHREAKLQKKPQLSLPYHKLYVFLHDKYRQKIINHNIPQREAKHKISWQNSTKQNQPKKKD